MSEITGKSCYKWVIEHPDNQEDLELAITKQGILKVIKIDPAMRNQAIKSLFENSSRELLLHLSQEEARALEARALQVLEKQDPSLTKLVEKRLKQCRSRLQLEPLYQKFPEIQKSPSEFIEKLKEAGVTDFDKLEAFLLATSEGINLLPDINSVLSFAKDYLSVPKNQRESVLHALRTYSQDISTSQKEIELHPIIRTLCTLFRTPDIDQGKICMILAPLLYNFPDISRGTFQSMSPLIKEGNEGELSELIELLLKIGDEKLIHQYLPALLHLSGPERSHAITNIRLILPSIGLFKEPANAVLVKFMLMPTNLVGTLADIFIKLNPEDPKEKYLSIEELEIEMPMYLEPCFNICNNPSVLAKIIELAITGNHRTLLLKSLSQIPSDRIPIVLQRLEILMQIPNLTQLKFSENIIKYLSKLSDDKFNTLMGVIKYFYSDDIPFGSNEVLYIRRINKKTLASLIKNPEVGNRIRSIAQDSIERAKLIYQLSKIENKHWNSVLDKMTNAKASGRFLFENHFREIHILFKLTDEELEHFLNTLECLFESGETCSMKLLEYILSLPKESQLLLRTHTFTEKLKLLAPNLKARLQILEKLTDFPSSDWELLVESYIKMCGESHAYYSHFPKFLDRLIDIPKEDYRELFTVILDQILSVDSLRSNHASIEVLLNTIGSFQKEERNSILESFLQIYRAQEKGGDHFKNINPEPLISKLSEYTKKEREEIIEKLLPHLPCAIANELFDWFPLNSLTKCINLVAKNTQLSTANFREIFAAVPEVEEELVSYFQTNLRSGNEEALTGYVELLEDFIEIFGHASPIVIEIISLQSDKEMGKLSPYTIYNIQKTEEVEEVAPFFHTIESQSVSLSPDGLKKGFIDRTSSMTTVEDLIRWMDKEPTVSLKSILKYIDVIEETVLPIVEKEGPNQEEAKTYLKQIEKYKKLAIPFIKSKLTFTGDINRPVDSDVLQFITLFKNLHLFSDALESTNSTLTVQQTHVLIILEAVQSCPGGQTDAVNILYTALTKNPKVLILGPKAKLESVAKASSFLWNLYESWAIDEVSTESEFMKFVCGGSKISQLSHHAMYVKNFLARYISISSWPQVHFDQHTALLTEKLVEYSRKELLEIFNEKANITKLIEQCIEAVNVQMTQGEKTYQNLVELLKELPGFTDSELSNVWTLDEEGDMPPKLTPYGAILLLKAIGAFEVKKS